jgi:hypothetical protein
VSAWSGGNFAGSLVVTNVGQEAVNIWWIEFDLSGNGWIMTSWNGTFQQSDNHVRVDAPIWHPHLQPTEYAEPGFTGTYSATLGVVLSNIRLNGVPCNEPISIQVVARAWVSVRIPLGTIKRGSPASDLIALAGTDPVAAAQLDQVTRKLCGCQNAA